jgi:hypothetical protein
MAGKRKPIRQDIIKALKKIDKGQGYNHTVGLVDDKKHVVENMKDHQFPGIFVIYGSPETSEFETVGAEYIDSKLHFMLLGTLKVKKGDSEADAADDFVQDVKKALYEDMFRDGQAEGTIVNFVDVDTISALPTVFIDIGVLVEYQEERSSL